MATCLYSNFPWTVLHAVAETAPQETQADRIAAALGLVGEPLPEVDDEVLFRYYEYLAEHLAFPFAAHYPEPSNQREQAQFRCQVWELLDPSEQLGDIFDGVFCQTRKGEYELNLPLIDLHVAEDSPNFQLLEDFRHWLAHWR
jgi:hypothetical protein